MFLYSLLIIAGILFLYFGADLLIRGSVRMALALGVAPLIIGLTIVSLGTSLPEGVASLMAQLAGGRGSIAVGNILGSNIANVGLILGITAIFYPLNITSDLIRRETPIMLGLSLLLGLFMWDMRITMVEGIILLALMVLYFIFQVWFSRQAQVKVPPDAIVEQYKEAMRPNGRLWVNVLFVIGGLGILILGGGMLLEGSVGAARILGLSDRVIGITIFAIGTSSPEMATSLVAAYRREMDISVGNVVGSNIMNIVFIIGLVSCVKVIVFEPKLLSVDFPIMFSFSLAMYAMMVIWKKIHRVGGVILLLGYVGYIIFLLQ